MPRRSASTTDEASAIQAPMESADARVRQKVRRFQIEHGVGGKDGEANAFPAYWLTIRHGLSPRDALAQVSMGSGDGGLDAFYLDANPERPVLYLYQAKYSASLKAVKDGLEDLERVTPLVARLLNGRELEQLDAQNVIVNLRGALERHAELRPKLQLNFVVLHLCTDDPELIASRAASSVRRLEQQAARYMFDNPVIEPQLVGGATIAAADDGFVVRPRSRRTIRFNGTVLQQPDGAAYYAGVGRLADLVDLYEEYHDTLFERNVRLYLQDHGRKGPGGHMRATLREICDRRVKQGLDPTAFAMFHNGVTIHAWSATAADGTLELRDPSVLNGCQTVKNAYFFRHDEQFAPYLDEGRWDTVPIPLRVLITNDENFVRRVAVSNNRQTEIRPAALYANEPVQVELEQRFRDAGIFYQRQEGSFKARRMSEAATFLATYSNSSDGPVTIEELAQAIATAAPRPALSVAGRVSSLFEESQYRQIFAENRLERMELLVFLRNLLRWMPSALKDLRDSSDTHRERLAKLPVGKFRYPCARILARFIVAHKPRLVSQFGHEVIATSRRSGDLRTALVGLMYRGGTRLYARLPEMWSDGQGAWRDPFDASVIATVLREMDVDRIDVFTT